MARKRLSLVMLGLGLLGCQTMPLDQSASRRPAAMLSPARALSRPGPGFLSGRLTGRPAQASQSLDLALTYRVKAPAAGFRSQALDCSAISFLKIEVEGIGLASPIRADGADCDGLIANSGCSFSATISNIPYGAGRIATVTAYDAARQPIPGGTVQTAFTVSAEPLSLTLGFRSSLAARVVTALRALGDSETAELRVARLDLAALATLLDQITGTSGSFPNESYTTHPLLIDAAAVANAIVSAGGTAGVNTAEAALRLAPGTVTGTISGLPDGATVGLRLNDPLSSEISAQGNGPFSFSGLPPGTWQLNIELPEGYALTTKPSPLELSPGESPSLGSLNLVNRLRWSQVTSRAVTGPISIGADGTIYLSSTSGTLYAFNPDGSEIWRKAAETHPVIGSSGILYVGGSRVRALSASGDELWSFGTNSTFTMPVIGADGTLYSISNQGIVYAINPDGSQKWMLQADASINFSSQNFEVGPALGADGTLYIGTSAGKLLAINPDGSRGWTAQIGGAIYSSPAIGSDGTIYLGSDSGTLKALNPDGSEKWQLSLGSILRRSPAIGSDGSIYVTGSDKVFAVSPEGSKRWEYFAGGSGDDYFTTSPTIDSTGLIYLGNNNGQLYAFHPDGNLAWTYRFGPHGDAVSTSPAIGPDGSLYAASKISNTLFALVTGSQGLADSPWPKAFRNAANRADADQIPALHTLSPSFAPVGQTHVELLGQLFDPLAANNIVRFGEQSVPASDITVLSPSRLRVRLPAGLSGRMPVTVQLGERVLGPQSLTQIETPPSLRWSLEGAIRSPALAPDGTVYVATGASVKALSPEGVQQWNAFYGESHNVSSPVVGADGTMYYTQFVGSFYQVMAFNPDGSRKWASPYTNTRSQYSPALGPDGTLYVGGDLSQYVRAFNPDGTARFQLPFSFPSQSSPTVAADGTFYLTIRNILFAYAPDGTKLWQYHTGNLLESTPALAADGTIYVTSNRNSAFRLLAGNPGDELENDESRLYALHPNGSLKWFYANDPVNFTSSATVAADGTVFVGGDDGKVYALNADGSLKWIFATDGPVYSTPTLAADAVLYVGSDDHKLYALYATDGSLKWAYPTGGRIDSSPAIAPDGTIYFTSGDGKLYALAGSSPGLATGGWPKFHGDNRNSGLQPSQP